jgi:hypothetical protein
MLKIQVKNLLLLVALCIVGLTAAAQKTYRCPTPGGGTTFTDTPCAGGQGGELSVKPASGSGAGNTPKPNPQSREAMSKRDAEIFAMLSPQCQRAHEAYAAKSRQKGGTQELSNDSNPVVIAWQNCEPETLKALRRMALKEQANAQADEPKRNESAGSSRTPKP